MSQESVAPTVTQQEQQIIPLSGIETDILQIRDYDLDVVYKRVKDPADNPTSLWTVHFRDNGTENWFTVNGALTSRYSVALTEKILGDIQTNIGGSLLDHKVRRSGTYIKSLFLMSGFDLETEQVNAADKILFKLITGVDIDQLNSRKSLSFCAVNGFAGNFALTLYYGILTLFSGNDSANKLINHGINNIFVLNDFSTRLVHDTSLQISYSEVNDVKANLTAIVESYKRTQTNIQFIEKFYKLFPKKFTKVFCTLYDDLPNEYKNLYYVTQIWSHLCSAANDVYLEIRLRNFLSAYMVSIRNAEGQTQTNNP